MEQSLAGFMRGLLDAYPDPLLLLDREGRILLAGRATESTFVRGAAGDATVPRLGDLEHARPVLEGVARSAQSGESVRLQTAWPTAAGPRHYEVTLTPVRGLDGVVTFVVAIFNDVTPRRATESLLREREALFSLIFQNSPIGIATITPNRRIVRVNRRFCLMLGYDESELVGVDFEDVTYPDDLDLERQLSERLFAGEIEQYALEKRYLRKSGEPVWVALTRSLVRDPEGQPLYGLAMMEDITERRRMQADHDAIEQRIRETQKLESLGVLAGGIAHDFNNLLVPILGNAELLAQELRHDATWQAPVRDIIVAANRAADLAKQMLAYSGRGRFVVQRADVSALVNDMSYLLRAALTSDHSIHLQLALDLPPVNADAAQIQQLVTNLVLNADEAIGPRAGSIVLRTESRHVSQDLLDQMYLAGDLPEGPYAWLSVTDTGSGMDEQTRSRIFDPFFSTKGTGRGLGMSAVLGIVRGHRGGIRVESQAGGGTTVTVVLPAAGLSGAAAAAPTHGPARQGTARERGVVLLVEDDESLRALTSRMLARLGFEVIGTADGAEALGSFAEAQDRIAAALVDLRVRRVDGAEVCRRLRALALELPIVAMTGGSGADPTRDALPDVTAWLQKPFTLQTLQAAMRHALGD